MRSTQLVDSFRLSAPYVNAHRQRTFVVMLSGEAIEDPNYRKIINDIALLNSLGIRVVLVYGARPQINEALMARGQESDYYEGVRVTDFEALQVIKEVAGSLQLSITARLSMSLSNTPMQGAHINVVSGNFVIAQPLGVVDGIDFCHSGRVRRIDGHGISRQLDDGDIVLLGPICASVTGESFNLTAEEIALHLAIKLNADKIIGFSKQLGVLDENGEVVPEMTPVEVEKLLQQPEHPTFCCSAVRPFLEAALKACRQGVQRCHLVSYNVDGALLQELFSRDGIGTQIVVERAEQVRKATIGDIGGILELIRPLEQQGILVRRSREQLEVEIGLFTVIERDGLVIGCAALYPFPEEACGELACLAVHPDYRDDDRGYQLLESMINEARKKGFKQIFALTTRSIHWFLENGFSLATVDDLPPGKAQLYNYQRRSKILTLPVQP